MDSAQQLDLHSVNLGDGLWALSAMVRQSALVMVVVKNRKGEQFNARLDVGKMAFIDPLPAVPSDDGIRAVADAISDLRAR